MSTRRWGPDGSRRAQSSVAGVVRALQCGGTRHAAIWKARTCPENPILCGCFPEGRRGRGLYLGPPASRGPGDLGKELQTVLPFEKARLLIGGRRTRAGVHRGLRDMAFPFPGACAQLAASRTSGCRRCRRSPQVLSWSSRLPVLVTAACLQAGSEGSGGCPAGPGLCFGRLPVPHAPRTRVPAAAAACRLCRRTFTFQAERLGSGRSESPNFLQNQSLATERTCCPGMGF